MPLPLTASELNCAQNQGLWNADGINQPQDQKLSVLHGDEMKMLHHVGEITSEACKVDVY